MFNTEENNAKYIRLYEYFKNLILTGIMKPKEKMPSIRKCAENFALSRTTVETAYELLAAEGYIISKAQSGFYVCDVDLTFLGSVKKEENVYIKNSSKIKYDLVSSSADKSSFNFSIWRRYVKSALRQDERLISYGEYQGEYDLREAVCSYINKERGVVSTAEQIVIAAGTQNLISILCAITKELKNVAFIGSSFQQGKAVFEDYGKNIVSTSAYPCDMNTLSSSKPSLIYISPSHINSWGGVMQISSRIEILKYANENQCLIVEDDYDSEFRYYSKPVSSLQGMNAGQNVVYIGTFSKLLLPSIRISFMVLPKRLVERYKERGKLYNQTASKTEQIALCQYIRDGHLSAQLRKQRKLYNNKTKQICKKALQMLDEKCEFQECQASYLIKIKIKTSKSAKEIAQIFLQNEIKIKPITNEGDNAILLMSVTAVDAEKTDELMSTFKKVIDQI